MKRLPARNEDILNFIVRDYVRTALPVSSGKIFESGAAQTSSATIRNAMLKLDEEGFLEKPHTSAGRVPTDKAYRYFVNYLMERREPARRERETLDDIFERRAFPHERMFEELTRALSRHMRLFTAVASFGEDSVMRTAGCGLEHLMKEPEFENRDLARELAVLMDNLEDALGTYFRASDFEETEVFIGEENPARSAKSFSSLSVKFKDEEEGECLIFSVGPKRLDYERASSLINFVVGDLKKHERE